MATVVNDCVFPIDIDDIPQLGDILLVEPVSVGLLLAGPFFPGASKFFQAIFERCKVMHWAKVESMGERDVPVGGAGK